MSVVIKIVGLANGAPSPFDGEYLRSYDPSKNGMDAEGHVMLAHVVTSPNLADAKRYKGITEAHKEWTRVDKREPVRPDGRPNRPLTAFTVEMFDPKQHSTPPSERQ